MKKKLTVLALAFAMVLTMSYSVFASAGDNSGNNSGADSYSSDSASIVKYFTAAEGLTLPAETFTFQFKRVESKASNYKVATTVGKNTFNLVTDKAANAMDSANVTGTQNKVWTKSIDEIFPAASRSTDFPQAGEYTFEVSEIAGSNQNITYSTDKYTLRLMVNNDGKITDVTVENNNPSSADNGKKVDPTDTDPTNNGGNNPSGGDPTPSDSLGGFTFTNNFTKKVTTHDEPKIKNPDEDPDDPTAPEDIVKEDPNKNVDGAFVLDKYVLGAYGNQQKGFEFEVVVTLPESDKNYEVRKSGNVVGGTWGTDNKVTLKHGEEFKFKELPVGTKISVKEAAADNDGYTRLLTTSKNTSAETDKGVSDADATQATTVLITEDGGYAICRNSFNDNEVTPTGIIINNLPYVLLIGLALGGIVLFSRKRRYE